MSQPGAGGIVGPQALARSAPDGSTLSVVSNNVVVLASFNMPGDFTPIAVCVFTPVVLVVNPKVAATNAKEFVALPKAKPGELPCTWRCSNRRPSNRAEPARSAAR